MAHDLIVEPVSTSPDHALGALSGPSAAGGPLSRIYDAMSTAGADEKRDRSARRLRPLVSLLPYVARYRGRVVAALVALIVAALATLAVPLAVRRIIDVGFSDADTSLIDNYFAVMIAVVAVLAVASATRFYLV